MGKLIISGGGGLNGQVRLQGAKNSVLPILAATVLCAGKSVIKNCPALKDVYATFKILESLGCDVTYENGIATVNSANITNHYISEGLMREMRSSILFLGPLLARCGKAVISQPGGCELGPRPIDLHMKAFRRMGVDIQELHGYISCGSDRVKGQHIHLTFPSVGATENIMLLAVLADGETVISNAAKEPEIVDLQNFLKGCGADVKGAGTETVTIKGVDNLHSVTHEVIPDRIVAATYLSAAAACGGDVLITGAEPDHVQSVLTVLEEAGCEITQGVNFVRLRHDGPLRAVNVIKTQPYPGFPTDAQAPVMAALAAAQGTSVFIENIFESRYKHAGELIRLGADITVDGRVAVIRGVEQLSGTSVEATDLRGGAAMIVAGLAARGLTEISGLQHIDRGYEDAVRDLTALGAEIRRVES